MSTSDKNVDEPMELGAGEKYGFYGAAAMQVVSIVIIVAMLVQSGYFKMGGNKRKVATVVLVVMMLAVLGTAWWTTYRPFMDYANELLPACDAKLSAVEKKSTDCSKNMEIMRTKAAKEEASWKEKSNELQRQVSKGSDCSSDLGELQKKLKDAESQMITTKSELKAAKLQAQQAMQAAQKVKNVGKKDQQTHQSQKQPVQHKPIQNTATTKELVYDPSGFTNRHNTFLKSREALHREYADTTDYASFPDSCPKERYAPASTLDLECLQDLWESVGCSEEGRMFEELQDENSEYVESWRHMGTLGAIKRDMNDYAKKWSRSCECHGKNCQSPDDDLDMSSYGASCPDTLNAPAYMADANCLKGLAIHYECPNAKDRYFDPNTFIGKLNNFSQVMARMQDECNGTDNDIWGWGRESENMWLKRGDRVIDNNLAREAPNNITLTKSSGSESAYLRSIFGSNDERLMEDGYECKSGECKQMFNDKEYESDDDKEYECKSGKCK